MSRLLCYGMGMFAERGRTPPRPKDYISRFAPQRAFHHTKSRVSKWLPERSPNMSANSGSCGPTRMIA
jgi:hypothetical protein